MRRRNATEAYDEVVWSWRPVAGVTFVRSQKLLASNGGKKPVHQGEHDISRKATAQGRPDALRWTCMLVCALLVHIAHETAGAARTRSSLRPLLPGGQGF